LSKKYQKKKQYFYQGKKKNYPISGIFQVGMELNLEIFLRSNTNYIKNKKSSKKNKLLIFMANSSIYVGNIPSSYTEDEFRKDFGRFGVIKNFTFRPDRRIAFVEFEYVASANEAISEMNGKEGMKVEIQKSKKRCTNCGAEGHYENECTEEKRAHRVRVSIHHPSRHSRRYSPYRSRSRSRSRSPRRRSRSPRRSRSRSHHRDSYSRRERRSPYSSHSHHRH